MEEEWASTNEMLLLGDSTEDQYAVGTLNKLFELEFLSGFCEHLIIYFKE